MEEKWNKESMNDEEGDKKGNWKEWRLRRGMDDRRRLCERRRILKGIYSKKGRCYSKKEKKKFKNERLKEDLDFEND